MDELIVLVRGEEFPAPHRAEVHPDELDNYLAGGWHIYESAQESDSVNYVDTTLAGQTFDAGKLGTIVFDEHGRAQITVAQIAWLTAHIAPDTDPARMDGSQLTGMESLQPETDSSGSQTDRPAAAEAVSQQIDPEVKDDNLTEGKDAQAGLPGPEGPLPETDSSGSQTDKPATARASKTKGSK